MERAPLLGHLVLYSIFDGRITRDDLARWFSELALNPAFLPPEIRAVDAFEKVTGDVKVSYPLDGQHATARRRRGRQVAQGRTATLMVRHVRRDPGQIVRHLVREIRDEQQTQLSYDVKVGECVFRRETAPSAAHGAGSLHLAPDFTAVPGVAEQERIRAVLGQIQDAYRHYCTYLTGDRLRGVIRTYIESLNAIKVRPTSGVYFVHRRHETALAALWELVTRFGAGSHLVRIPLPDEAEMRDMVIQAFTTRAKDDLDRLARDIVAAQADGEAGQATVQALYRRYRDLETAATEHSQLLSVGLDDTTDRGVAHKTDLESEAKPDGKLGREADRADGGAPWRKPYCDASGEYGRKRSLDATCEADGEPARETRRQTGRQPDNSVRCHDVRGLLNVRGADTLIPTSTNPRHPNAYRSRTVSIKIRASSDAMTATRS